MNPLFVSRKDLPRLVGLAYSTIWRMEKEGKFPKRRLLTDSRVAWLYSELEAWASDSAIAQA